jgi:hypothetical protein
MITRQGAAEFSGERNVGRFLFQKLLDKPLLDSLRIGTVP